MFHLSAKSPRYLSRIAGISLILVSGPAAANVIFGGGGGYTTGFLYRKTRESMSGLLAQGWLGYSFSRVNLHGFADFVDISYAENGEARDGAYNLYGAGGTWQVMRGEKRNIVITGQVPLVGTLTLLAKSKSSINNQQYEVSSLSTLSGKSGVHLQVGYEFLGEPRRRNTESYTTGIYLGYLNQTFNTVSTRIKANNPDLAPPSPGGHTVAYSVSLITLSMSASYEL